MIGDKWTLSPVKAICSPIIAIWLAAVFDFKCGDVVSKALLSTKTWWGIWHKSGSLSYYYHCDYVMCFKLFNKAAWCVAGGKQARALWWHSDARAGLRVRSLTLPDAQYHHKLAFATTRVTHYLCYLIYTDYFYKLRLFYYYIPREKNQTRDMVVNKPGTIQ